MNRSQIGALSPSIPNLAKFSPLRLLSTFVSATPTKQYSVEDSLEFFSTKRVTVVIPTYKPNETTIALVHSIRKFNPEVHIVVVNDCIPPNSTVFKMYQKIAAIAKKDSHITCLKTKENSHKAGALNLGISHALAYKHTQHVIFTCDDDIIINKDTLPLMLRALYASDHVGAVCSRSLVKNKHQNLLTRLQALEYFGFTTTKIADNNFLHGPLVMQGMLTGFRAAALRDVEGFTPHHLIEDYDITVRIKKNGWKVAIARDAQAWTIVPDNLQELWKQRVRWGYWGMIVMKDNISYLPTIFQDFLGHMVFVNLLLLIVISLLFYRPESITSIFVQSVFVVSAVQFVLTTLFGFITMFSYEDRDKKDWLLRLTILPELMYSNIITLVLIGCYFYFVYNILLRRFTRRVSRLDRIHAIGLKGFARVGYAHHWNTRGIE